MFCIKHCLLICAFLVVVTSYQTGDLLIEIKNGLIRGRKAATVGFNLTYYAYQGIPYAEPPIGALRFQPPVPKKNWTNIYDATKDGNICVQSNPPIGSEDCLFINVYVPEVTHKELLLPVMVWIYGGGFEAGFATYDLFGSDYLLEKNVIIVNFNYRLGLLGFLSTGDLVVPGNNGLKDQALALKWVQENIEKFGGDPKRVTIFGQSAGSVSVAYHVMSPQSKGLFQRAIMESGVSLCAWAISRRAPEVAKQIAKKLGVDTSSSQKMVDELRKIDFKELQTTAALTAALQYLTNDPRNGFVFSPVIEPSHPNAFFTEKPHAFLERGAFNPVPCIIGYNSLEGTFNFGTLFKIYLLQYDFNHARLLPYDLNIDEKNKSVAASYIKKYYFGKGLIAFSDRKLMKYISDDLFVRPVREFVRLVSKKAPVYYYKFAYEGGLWGFVNRSLPGVAHSEELGYLYRSNFTASDKDILTRKRMTSMWTDFAKTGNPTPKKYFTSLETMWKPTDENFTYLEIGDELILKQFPEKPDMEMWDQIYQVFGKPPYDTY